MVWPAIELYLWTYAACMWVSFGLYAHGHAVWNFREAFGVVIHGANSGMLAAWASADFAGINEPWKVMAIACGVSIGWTQKEFIREALVKIMQDKKGALLL